MPYKDPDRQREYQREWYAKRRFAYFADKTCVRCGSKVDLELDHIDPLVKVSHHIWSWSAERRQNEIAKCQVLCRECHKTKTIDNGDNAKYGTDQPLAKVDDEAVRQMRRDRETNATPLRQLADQYGISLSTTWKIINKKKWKHIE